MDFVRVTIGNSLWVFSHANLGELYCGPRECVYLRVWSGGMGSMCWDGTWVAEVECLGPTGPVGRPFVHGGSSLFDGQEHGWFAWLVLVHPWVCWFLVCCIYIYIFRRLIC